MLRSGKELKVFAVKDTDLQRFCMEARKYGVLYTVLKDRDANDGLTDIMVRAEDASKINRIFERFKLATVDMGSVKAEIEQERAERDQAEKQEPSDRAMTHQEKVDRFLDEALKKKPAKEEPQNTNPINGRTARSRQSEPFSERKSPIARDASEKAEHRPSVKKQLEEIRLEQKQKAGNFRQNQSPPVNEHKAPKKKRKRSKKEREIINE